MVDVGDLLEDVEEALSIDAVYVACISALLCLQVCDGVAPVRHVQSDIVRSVDPVAGAADTDHHTPGLDVWLLADRVGDHVGYLRDGCWAAVGNPVLSVLDGAPIGEVLSAVACRIDSHALVLSRGWLRLPDRHQPVEALGR